MKQCSRPERHSPRRAHCTIPSRKHRSAELRPPPIACSSVAAVAASAAATSALWLGGGAVCASATGSAASRKNSRASWSTIGSASSHASAPRAHPCAGSTASTSRSAATATP